MTTVDRVRDTHDRVERIQRRRVQEVIRRQLEAARKTLPWTEAELREAWGR